MGRLNNSLLFVDLVACGRAHIALSKVIRNKGISDPLRSRNATCSQERLALWVMFILLGNLRWTTMVLHQIAPQNL